MQIKRFDIQNFRKLKCCKIELSDKTTVFVGANNSESLSEAKIFSQIFQKIDVDQRQCLQEGK